MGKIFYIMGKSASGKDKIYSRLAGNKELDLKKLILYTTRPVRDGEKDGVQYYFTDERRLQEFETAGKVIESRAYNTVYGIWTYFYSGRRTDRPEQWEIILESERWNLFQKSENVIYGKESVIPVYIEVEDGERLIRAIRREQEQETPKYKELCRRFLADEEDFSEEKNKRGRYTEEIC